MKKLFGKGSKSSNTLFISPNSTTSIVQGSIDPEDPILVKSQKLTQLKLLGKGSFGRVYLNRLKNKNGEEDEVAIKEFHTGSDAENDFKSILREIRTMHDLSHSNIVKLHGINIEHETINLVLEYCSGGSLRDRLRDNNKPVFLVTNLLNFARQLGDGMAYLAEKRYIHRDLATRNILLTSDESKVKIADFGLTRFLNKDKAYKMQSKHGLPYPWCSPEVLVDKTFSYASDVWAFGVTLWEIFTYGQYPWLECVRVDDINVMLLYSKIFYEKRCLSKPDPASSEIYELMTSCWEIEPSKRPTITTLKTKLQKLVTYEIPTKSILGDHPFDKEENVIIIDKEKGHWFGQGSKSGQFGYFTPISEETTEVPECIYNSINTTTISAMLNDQVLANRDKKVKKANAKTFYITAYTIGRVNLVVHIDGRYFIMYPRKSNLEQKYYTTLTTLDQEFMLDCCIGCPSDDVIKQLYNSYQNLEWITWNTNIEKDLIKQLPPEKHNKIHGHESKIHPLNLRGSKFHVYENNNGYIIKGPHSTIIYLWTEDLQEETKQYINFLKPIDLAFFCNKNIERPGDAIEAFKHVKPRKALLLFSKDYTNDQLQKFKESLASKDIREDDFHIFEKYNAHQYCFDEQSNNILSRYRAIRSLMGTNWIESALNHVSYSRFRNDNDNSKFMVKADNRHMLDISSEA